MRGRGCEFDMDDSAWPSDLAFIRPFHDKTRENFPVFVFMIN